MRLSLRSIAQSFNARIKHYRRVLNHPQTPWLSRVLLWLAVAYALSPIDLIPDFIPVLGQLDDLVLVPALILAALWMIPEEVLQECEQLDS